jgi:hypothetical protein
MVSQCWLFSRANRSKWRYIISFSFDLFTSFTAKSSHYCCATCGFKSCFNCRSPAHENITCAEYKRKRIKREHINEERASKQWLGVNAKICSCGRYCEKISGCDHIICDLRIGGCGAEWCWSCGAQYQKIREIGNSAHKRSCPWYA